MVRKELYSRKEDGKLTECTISQPLDSTRPTVKLVFEKKDGETTTFLLTGPSDLGDIGELFSGYHISIEKDSESQMEFGTISVNVFGESYTEIFFDSIEVI